MLVLAQSRKVLGQSMVVNGTQKGGRRRVTHCSGNRRKSAGNFSSGSSLFQGGRAAAAQAFRGKDSSGGHLRMWPREAGPTWWPVAVFR